jgi:hypothetical protein
MELSNGISSLLGCFMIERWRFWPCYRCLYSCKLRGVGEDKLWRVPSRKGIFEVKSFYRVLSSFGSISFPWKSISRSS